MNDVVDGGLLGLTVDQVAGMFGRSPVLVSVGPDGDEHYHIRHARGRAGKVCRLVVRLGRVIDARTKVRGTRAGKPERPAAGSGREVHLLPGV
jgi:hypothetical protein